MNNTTFGRAGEQSARAYLRRKGYRILAANYKAGSGELDIVALKRGVLVFAEVKTRSNEKYGSPAEAVGAKKTACLRSAANAFVYEQCRHGRVTAFLPFGIRIMLRYKQTRNDIIEVYTDRNGGNPYKINHIENAF